MVSVGWSTAEETSNNQPTEHLGADNSKKQSSSSTGPAACWHLWFPVWKPRLLQALGASKPLGAHLGPRMGLEGKREWSAKGALKIPFMGMVGGRIFPAAPRDTEVTPRDALGGLKMKRKGLKRNSQGN